MAPLGGGGGLGGLGVGEQAQAAAAGKWASSKAQFLLLSQNSYVLAAAAAPQEHQRHMTQEKSCWKRT